MKSLISFAALVCTLVGFVSTSQAQEQFIELLRSDMQTEKKAVLTLAMEMSDEQASLFWPVYREYEVELAKNTDGTIALIKDYAMNFETMTEDKADDLIGKSFKLQEEELKIRKKYYKKVAKALSPIMAAKFVQIENQIGMLIDLQIAGELPLVQPAKSD